MSNPHFMPLRTALIGRDGFTRFQINHPIVQRAGDLHTVYDAFRERSARLSP